MTYRRNEKLTDLINKRGYVFSRKAASFEEAYPTIAKLQVQVIESEYSEANVVSRWIFNESNFRHAVNCSNRLCYGGGVEVGFLIHEMVRSKDTDREDRKACQGYEGSPKGKRRYRSCMHYFLIKVHIEYKPEAEPLNP